MQVKTQFCRSTPCSAQERRRQTWGQSLHPFPKASSNSQRNPSIPIAASQDAKQINKQIYTAEQSYWKPSKFQCSNNLPVLFEHKPEIERSAIKFFSDANKNIKFQQYADFLKMDICLHLGFSYDYIQQQWKDESIPLPISLQNWWVNIIPIKLRKEQWRKSSYLVLIWRKYSHWS